MSAIAHPAKGELARRRITNKALAAAYGCSDTYVSRVLLGRYRPSRGFKTFVATLLELPEDELFDDELAAAGA